MREKRGRRQTETSEEDVEEVLEKLYSSGEVEKTAEYRAGEGEESETILVSFLTLLRGPVTRKPAPSRRP